MRKPNRRLFTILGLGWLAFIGLGLGLGQWATGPAVTVIIDRSYCAPAQWRAQARRYADLYAQQAENRLTISRVIYVSDLGQEVATTIPSPDEVSTLTTFGRFNADHMNQAMADQPDAEVLSCHVGAP